MTHKKWIKRGDKVFGPYLYRTYRDEDGNIKTEYIGKDVEKINLQKFQKFLLLSLFFIFLFFIFLIIIKHKIINFQGQTVNLQKINFLQNETIKGVYELSLKEGELLPLNITVSVTLGHNSKVLSLKEWLDSSNLSYPTVYDYFYKENIQLKGEGDGLGKAGKHIEKPTISFKIRTFEITNQTQTNETTNETNQSEIPAINESMPIKSISGFSIFYPINPLSFIYFISALKTLIGFAIVEEMEVSVNADMPFVYEIPPGYDAEIVENSMNINGTPVSIELLQISKRDNILTISTNYIIIREGFGEEFLGDTYTIPLSIDVLNLQAEPGILEIKLIYDNIVLFDDQIQITTEAQPQLTAQPTSTIQEFQVQQTCYCDSCANCTAQLNDPSCSEVLLTTDIIDNPGGCIDNPENFSNKVFDCQGHIINIAPGCSYPNFCNAIYLDGKQNNIIKNCAISSFPYPLLIKSSSNITITNNSLTNNEYPITFQGTNLSTISFNIFTDNIYADISLDQSYNNTIDSNNITELGYSGGVYVTSGSAYNNITNNNITSRNPDWLPIILDNAGENFVYGNYIYDSFYGIKVINTNNARLIANTIKGSRYWGVVIESGSGTKIEGNLFMNNGAVYIITNSPRAWNGINWSDTLAGSNTGFFVFSSEATQVTADNTEVPVDGISNLSLGLVEGAIGYSTIILVNSIASNCTELENYLAGIGYSATCHYFEKDVWIANGLGMDYTANFNTSTSVIEGFTTPPRLETSPNYGGLLLGSDTFVNANNFTNNAVAIKISSGSGNNLTSNFIEGNSKGIVLDSSSNNIITNNTASSNQRLDVYIENSVDNTFINQTIAGASFIYPTKISFTYAGNVSIKGISSPPVDPLSFKNIGKYLNITSTDWIFLNVSYLEQDLNNINESTLRMSKYNGSWYTDPSFFATSYGVDTANNIVYANITSFSVFAPLGQAVCYCDSCANCTAQLNDPSCSEVLLTTDIIDNPGGCIDNPENFSNKVFDCQGHIIDGTYSVGYGVYLSGKQNNTIKNCIITDFREGIHLSFSSNNSVVNNTVNSNAWYGIYLSNSFNIKLINNTVKENRQLDIDIYGNSTEYCDNIIENNTGSGDRPIKYYNYTVNLQDEIFSELIL
ncbi:MAG: NosD domain-containing protein, partial [Candidatus Pacearchaeota archaeon]